MFDRQEINPLNIMKFGLRFRYNIDDFIDWLRSNKMLATCMICPCGDNMREGSYSRGIDGRIWRCPIRCKTINIQKGSFFVRSHLQLWQILLLTYEWVMAKLKFCPTKH